MKKIMSIITVALLSLSLCSCGKYVSSYKAVCLIKNQTSHSCEASFDSLEGQLVFKIKKSERGEGSVNYSVQVEEGEIRLYCDVYDYKQELAHVKAGDSVTDRGGYVEGKQTVYIIIEGSDNAKGKVSVELD